MKKSFTLALIVMFTTGSCASYTPQSVPKPQVESMSLKGENERLGVGVSPYIDEEKNKHIFGADLLQAGVLPLHVVVTNNSQRRISIRKTDFILKLAENQEFLPAPTTSVANRLESSAAVIGWTIGFGLIGLLASSTHQEKVDSARRTDLRNKEFKDATLDPTESADGFLFYLIPENTQEIKATNLTVKALDVADATGITVAIPIGDMEVRRASEEE